MKWRYISLTLGVLIIYGAVLAVLRDTRLLQTDPVSLERYVFSDDALERERRYARRGQAWNGICQKGSTWTTKNSEQTWLAADAAKGGNVLAMVCFANIRIRNQDPISVEDAYRLLSLALLMTPRLPVYLKNLHAEIGSTLTPVQKSILGDKAHEDRARLIRAGLYKRHWALKPVSNVKLNALPMHEEVLYELSQYRQKLAYWRHKCPTKTDLQNAKFYETMATYNIVAKYAIDGDVDAMLCMARQKGGVMTSEQKRAYYWYALALLFKPEIAPNIQEEMQGVANELPLIAIKQIRKNALKHYCTSTTTTYDTNHVCMSTRSGVQ